MIVLLIAEHGFTFFMTLHLISLTKIKIKYTILQAACICYWIDLKALFEFSLRMDLFNLAFGENAYITSVASQQILTFGTTRVIDNKHIYNIKIIFFLSIIYWMEYLSMYDVYSGNNLHLSRIGLRVRYILQVVFYNLLMQPVSCL